MTNTFDAARHANVADIFDAGASLVWPEPTDQQDTGALTQVEISGATVVTPGSSIMGSISTSGEQDFYSVTLELGKTYIIDALGSPSGGGSIGETDLHFYDADGNYIEYDDLDGDGFDAKITFTATTTGTYYIMVDSYFADDTGTYTLEIEETLPPPVGTYQELATFLQSGYQGGTTYTFDTSTSNVITVNISGLTEDGQQLALWAMQAWEMVVDIDFQVVASGEMITVDDEDSGAFAYFPNAGSTTSGVELNVSTGWLATYGTTLDSYSFQTYVHEFGHALGLGHQGAYNGSATYGVDENFANDSWQMSVMSYFSQTDNTTTNASYALLAGTMMADILAIQGFYGAPDDSSATAGDTIYGLGSNLGSYMDEIFAGMASGTTSANYTGSTMAFTIYDQGGTDTLDVSFLTGAEAAIIDMNDGSFSDFGTNIGVMGIAVETVLENVISGAGNDVILGNDADNVIAGGLGNDTIDGGAGVDVIIGGGQNDMLTGGADDDVFIFNAKAGKITDYRFVGVNAATGELDGDLIVLEDTTSYSFSTSDGHVNLGGIQVQSNSVSGNIAVLSGAGTDFSSLSGPADLVLSGLKLTIHNFETAGRFDYEEYSFAVNGLVSRIHTFYDNLTSVMTDFDASANRTWETIQNFLNASEQVYENRVNYDTGTQIRTLTDVEGTNVWETVLEYRDDAGALYDKRTNYDDGSQLRVVFDSDATQAWATVFEFRDDAGALYDKRTNYDDSSQLRVVFDIDATQVWDTILEHRNASNELYRKTTNYDDGRQKLTVYDVDDLYTWEEYTRVFDSDGMLLLEYF